MYSERKCRRVRRADTPQPVVVRRVLVRLQGALMRNPGR